LRFADHFSRLAGDYARYRPHHPAELFEYLAGIVPSQELAWDCGTGSGQAALLLARHFKKVNATDASREQLAHAVKHERVEYRAEPAEKVSLDSNSADLVTVAVAVHWFDLPGFYKEVRRVLKPQGVIAVWTYQFPIVTEEIVEIVRVYYRDVLACCWPEQIKYVEQKYQNLPFPFAEIQAPAFQMKAEWDLMQFAGFLSSWSAAGRYLEEKGTHPLEEIWTRLKDAWGEEDRLREVVWPLYIRVGRV
jgi:SAM-dependent methyltransferase